MYITSHTFTNVHCIRCVLFVRTPFTAYSVGILEQSMGTRNLVGIGLSYLPARLHMLAKSIPGLLESLKISSHCLLPRFKPIDTYAQSQMLIIGDFPDDDELSSCSLPL